MKLVDEIYGLNDYICGRLNDLTELKNHILERCHCALYKILDSERELDFTEDPIEVMKGKSVTKIYKNEDGKYVVGISSIVFSGCVYLDSFTPDEEIKLIKSICKRFIRKNDPTFEYERLKKLLLEKLALTDTYISYIGNVGVEYKGLGIDFVARIGNFIHLYDGDPFAPTTNELTITDKSCLCDIISKILEHNE